MTADPAAFQLTGFEVGKTQGAVCVEARAPARPICHGRRRAHRCACTSSAPAGQRPRRREGFGPLRDVRRHSAALQVVHAAERRRQAGAAEPFHQRDARRRGRRGDCRGPRAVRVCRACTSRTITRSAAGLPLVAKQAVFWVPDPQYSTQVNYNCQTPCLLECRPPHRAGRR